MKVNNAVIMAAGMSTRFVPMSIDVPKALIKVNGEVLIERMIRQLRDSGIQEVVVVTGYKSEMFDYLKQKLNVVLVHNPEYETRNNHSSLYYAQDYLRNTYICSADNYYPENLFQKVESYAFYATLFSNGDTKEWCVTTDSDGYINEVTIGGSDSDFLYGHAFFDEKFSDDFKIILNNSYHSIDVFPKFWESLYIENLNLLKLKVKRYKDNQILEFDSLKELKKFDNWYKLNTESPTYKYILNELDTNVSSIKRCKPILSGKELIGFKFRYKKEKYKYMIDGKLIFKEKDLIAGHHIDIIEQVLHQELNNYEDLEVLGATKLGGLTNDNYLVRIGNERLVFRIPGNGSNSLINREHEWYNMLAAKTAGVDAEVIHFNVDSGIKITRYIDDSETMSSSLLQFEDNYVVVADLFNILHCDDIESTVNFETFSKIEFYEKLIKKSIDIPFESYEEIKKKVSYLNDKISNLISFCHNDPLPENFIKNSRSIKLIDWEYAGMNHPYWDLAAFILETNLNQQDEEKFLERYFKGSPTYEQIVQVNIQKILVDFLWSLWGLYFTTQGKDYMEYSENRFESCKNNVDNYQYLFD